MAVVDKNPVSEVRRVSTDVKVEYRDIARVFVM
jgi:hypothetical protein